MKKRFVHRTRNRIFLVLICTVSAGLLFHNTTAKKATLRQMPEFLETLKREGYTFATLNPSVSNAPYIF